MTFLEAAGWRSALGLSVAAHMAFVLAPLTSPPAVDASPALVHPLELDLDVAAPSDSAIEEPLPDRVGPVAAPPPVRDVPRTFAAPARANASEARAVTAASDLVVAPARTELPRFTISLEPATTSARETTTAPPSALPGPSSDAEIPFAERAVDVPARLAHGEPALYPDGARADGVEGDVHLELVVSRAGLVESARVVGPLGRGLDEAAMAAAKTFRFTPAVKEGHPVRVRVSWTMQFRLQ